MIELRILDGEFCPLVLCDHCDQPIDRVLPGIVTWDQSLALRYLHEWCRDDRTTLFACELSEFFEHVMWNAGRRACARVQTFPVSQVRQRRRKRKSPALVDESFEKSIALELMKTEGIV